MDEPCRIFQGVEDHQVTADHELAEKLIFAERHCAHAVEGRGDFIVQIADHTAVRQRQLLVLHRRSEAFHVFFERFLRRAVEAFHQIVFADHQAILENLQANERLGADERIAPELLMRRVDGFEDEALRLTDELAKDGDGRIEIHGELRRDGDKIRRLCQFLKTRQRWLQSHHFLHPLSHDMPHRELCASPRSAPPPRPACPRAGA